jgi:Zn-dependent protease with chaperone function
VKSILAFKIGQEFWVKPNQGIGEETTQGFHSIGEIISNLLQNIYVVAGILLFILLIIGGFSFIMGAGQENPERAKRGKQAITAALIGFAVIFCSYWIIKIIEIITGLKIF